MKNLSTSYQQYLSQKEKGIKINRVLRSSLYGKMFPPQKRKRNFSFLFTSVAVGFAVLILMIFPLRVPWINQSLFPPHPTFLQEVHAAYADMTTTLGLPFVFYHVRTLHSHPGNPNVMSEFWTKSDGSFSVYQNTDLSSGNLMNRFMFKDGNSYTTQTQATLEIEARQEGKKTFPPPFDVRLPEGVTAMTQTYEQTDPYLHCIDLVPADDNIQDLITLKRSIELLQKPSWDGDDVQKMSEIVQELETNPRVRDLGEQSLPDHGLVHGFQLAYASSQDTLNRHVHVEYYFDVTTHRLKKWTEGDGSPSGTSVSIIEQDEVISEQDIPSGLMDPFLQDLVLLPKMDVQFDTPKYDILQSGCYRFGPYPKLEQLSSEEEKAKREYFTHKREADIEHGFQSGTTPIIMTLQTTLSF